MPEHAVLPVGEHRRLDHFLRDALPHLSRRQLRRLVESRSILVNGRPAKKGTALRPGDTVTVDRAIAETTELRPQPELALPILYRDAALLAVDKPSGMPSIALRPTDLGSAANFVAAIAGTGHETTPTGPGGSPLESGIVHRLDTGTSGVLIATRSSGAWRDLRRQLREQQVTKTYRALVRGSVQRGGALSTPLRAAKGAAHRVEPAAPGDPGARAARTEYRVVAAGDRASDLEVRIRTGHRHQIRAHLAALGHPIVGDALYGAGGEGERLFLHAWRVRLSHPESGREVLVESPLPRDFIAAARRLGCAAE